MSIKHKLNQSENHVAHLARYPHDMSQLFGFTMSTGMLLPVYKDFLNVGETVYLKHSMIARTQPIITAAMADVHFYVDWFFVPATMLFTPFGQYRWQTNDFISDQFTVPNSIVNDGYFPLFDVSYHMQTTSMTVADSTVYSYGGLPSSFGCHVQNTYRLAEHLGYNPAPVLIPRVDPYSPQTGNPYVFPIYALSYQAIYQKYYRDETYERLNVRSYNVDSLYQNPTGYASSSRNSRNLFQLRFANYKKDYFTSVRPAPYLSSLNLIGSDVSGTIGPDSAGSNPLQVLSRISSYLDRGNVFPYDSGLDGISSPYPSDKVGMTQSRFTQVGREALEESSVVDSSLQEIGFVENVLPPNFGTQSLRNMFAVEKLLRIVGMSKKDYDHQALAHFGFKVPHDVKHDLTHIFGNHSILHIGEILATADTFNATAGTGSALGQIGGKGYMYLQSEQKAHKFTAPCDGVIMAITYCVPDVMYYQAFDKANAITDMHSLYNPEFDKLGSQPLFKYEMVDSISDFTQVSDIMGWQYRYEQYKRKFNKVTSCFRRANNGVNIFASWFMSRVPYTDYVSGNLSFSQFKCPPTALDDMMVVKYNTSYSSSWQSSPWLIYQTDPFVCQFSADVKKLSTMSPYGEPDLNGI